MPRILSCFALVGLGLAVSLLIVHALSKFGRSVWVEGLMDVAMAAGFIGFYRLLARMFRESSARGVVAQAQQMPPEPVSVCRLEVHGKVWALRDLRTGLVLPLEEGDLFSIADPAFVPEHSNDTQVEEGR